IFYYDPQEWLTLIIIYQWMYNFLLLLLFY
ncbi:unnamed protein product, partial [Rotaria socialis]